MSGRGKKVDERGGANTSFTCDVLWAVWDVEVMVTGTEWNKEFITYLNTNLTISVGGKRRQNKWDFVLCVFVLSSQSFGNRCRMRMFGEIWSEMSPELSFWIKNTHRQLVVLFAFYNAHQMKHYSRNPNFLSALWTQTDDPRNRSSISALWTQTDTCTFPHPPFSDLWSSPSRLPHLGFPRFQSSPWTTNVYISWSSWR